MKARALTQLTRAVQGRVLSAKSPGFVEAQQIFNLGLQHTPRLIVECLDDGDVQAALWFAQDHDLPLTVRAGGHSVGGFSVARDGVVIDLRRRCEVSVDPRTRILTVGGGALWSDVLAATGPRLGTPGAFDPRVGVAGLTLGGGYGMLTRLHGLAADNLLSADVVTADGTARTTSAQQEPELFWALRGAGPNFAIATRLRFQLHRLEPLLFARVSYPLHTLRALLPRYRDFVAGLPAAATAYLGFSTSSEDLERVEVIAYWFGDRAEGQRVLAPISRFGQASTGQPKAMGYAAAHVPNHHTFPVDHHHSWRAQFLEGLSDPIFALLADHADRARGNTMWFVLEHLGGAMGEVAADATAFAHRRAKFGFVSAVKWARGAKKPAAALAVQTSLAAALERHGLGTYVNYAGPRPTRADASAAYGSNLPRLEEAKRTFDPDNFFRHNVNIRP